jgi:hypothetical protein
MYGMFAWIRYSWLEEEGLRVDVAVTGVWPKTGFFSSNRPASRKRIVAKRRALCDVDMTNSLMCPSVPRKVLCG